MRESFSDEELGTPANTNTSTTPGNHRVDLSERLKLKPAFNNPSSENTESSTTKETDPEQTETTSGTDGAGASASSATFDDGGGAPDDEKKFEDFADKIEDALSAEDAIEIAEMFVSIGNIGRMIFLPGLYEGFCYPGQERNDIRGVIAKSIENEKRSVAGNKVEPDEGFNDYEKRLFKKWPKFRASVENVSFTEPEIKTFAKYLAREIGEMTVTVWVRKHMWLLYWLYLETLHAKDIVGVRAQDWFSKKFGLS
jgi:hypothetical protein